MPSCHKDSSGWKLVSRRACLLGAACIKKARQLKLVDFCQTLPSSDCQLMRLSAGPDGIAARHHGAGPAHPPPDRHRGWPRTLISCSYVVVKCVLVSSWYEIRVICSFSVCWRTGMEPTPRTLPQIGVEVAFLAPRPRTLNPKPETRNLDLRSRLSPTSKSHSRLEKCVV